MRRSRDATGAHVRSSGAIRTFWFFTLISIFVDLLWLFVYSPLRPIAWDTVLALARKDHDMLADLAIAGGYKSPKMDREVIVKLLRFGNDTLGRDLLGDKNVAQFMDELKATDPYEEAADNLVLVGFMSFRLRIVGLALNHPVVCSDWWGKIAEEELRTQEETGQNRTEQKHKRETMHMPA